MYKESLTRHDKNKELKQRHTDGHQLNVLATQYDSIPLKTLIAKKKKKESKLHLTSEKDNLKWQYDHSDFSPSGFPCHKFCFVKSFPCPVRAVSFQPHSDEVTCALSSSPLLDALHSCDSTVRTTVC